MAADDARITSELAGRVVVPAQQLGDAMERLARASANMAAVNAWAKGMGAIAGPRERSDAEEAERKNKLFAQNSHAGIATPLMRPFCGWNA